MMIEMPYAINIAVTFAFRCLIKTSSSAGAERPRDALCPSVVSLYKITRAES